MVDTSMWRNGIWKIKLEFSNRRKVNIMWKKNELIWTLDSDFVDRHSIWFLWNLAIILDISYELFIFLLNECWIKTEPQDNSYYQWPNLWYRDENWDWKYKIVEIDWETDNS